MKTYTYNIGNVDVLTMNIADGEASVQTKHLTHVEKEFKEHLYELRLDIFRTNPNLSVNEMQEIEKWLLNK